MRNGAHRKIAFGASLIALKRLSVCTFRDVASATPQKYQLFQLEKQWFWPAAKRFPRARPLLFPRKKLILWGPAGATPRKVQNDIPFKAIKHSPNALFRRAPLPRLRFSTFHETYIYIRKRAKIWVQKHLKSRHAEWRASENCIWSFTYSFKKIVRLHFPRCRLRDPSKIPIIP